MYADYHIHSEFSDDSRELMENQIERGIALGLNEMCFTDHVDYGIKRDWDDPRGIKWRGGDGISSDSSDLEPMANVNYPDYFAKIHKMRETYGDKMKIKAGLEFGIQSITVEDYEKLYAKYNQTLCFSQCIRLIIRNSGRRISSVVKHSRNIMKNTIKKF